MAEDRLAQKLTHVGIAAVHLVDDEQVARDGATPEVRVGNREGTEQQLVDRADRNRCDEEAVA